MVYYFKPYDLGKNIGRAYNKHMALVPNDDDWGCLMDGDVSFLCPDWGTLIDTTIKENPEKEFFTCLTNRVGNKDQCYQGVIDPTFSILKLKEKSDKCRKDGGTKIRPAKIPISGMLMLIKKSLWNRCKFRESGILGVDNHFTWDAQKLGVTPFIITGLYVFHYYRLRKDRFDTSHLS